MHKIFLFFSDLRMIEPAETLKNITKIMEKNGMFLLDCDNVFRVISYLKENPKAPYKFDFTKMELIVNKDHNNKGVGIILFRNLKKSLAIIIYPYLLYMEIIIWRN